MNKRYTDFNYSKVITKKDPLYGCLNKVTTKKDPYLRCLIKIGAGLFLFILLIIATKLYFECNYYQVEFTNGDSYYVRDNKWEELSDGKIRFHSWLWNRKVEGYDYRIIEPIKF